MVSASRLHCRNFGDDDTKDRFTVKTEDKTDVNQTAVLIGCLMHWLVRRGLMSGFMW